MRGLGRFLVFGCCFLFGAVLAWRKREGLLKEKECLGLMRHGEERIKASLCPRSELFLDYSAVSLRRCGFLPSLQRGEDPYELCLAYKKELGLEEKSYECLCRYFSSLGKLGYEQQLKHCRECCEEMESLAKEHKKKNGDAISLYLTLGAAAGAFGVILLL